MRALEELKNVADPAFPLLLEWVSKAVRPVEIFPASAARDNTLFRTQVSAHSTLGAVVFETEGILIDHGWLPILGSGNARLTRTPPEWNEERSDGFYLIADDAVGGFFAVNGGTLGEDKGNVYYFAPDSLRWEPLKLSYTQFLHWSMSEALDVFYGPLRWTGWEKDVSALHGDRCFFFYPPLFTSEGKGGIGKRGEVPVHEAWGLQMDFRKQLGVRKS